MGDTWVTDMRHFPPPDEVLPESYAPARRLAAYLGSIVSAASVAPSSEVVDTALRCRRRPGRRPCPGYITLQRNESRIGWECSACDDNGVISGWQETHRDLSRLAVAEPGECRVELTADEYRALQTIWVRDPEEEWILAGARRSAGRVVIMATSDELESFAEWVAGEANHARAGERRQLLDSALERIEAVLTSGA
jgi:hypothetical protein